MDYLVSQAGISFTQDSRSVVAEYYRQTPPKVPHFLKTLFRRKLVIWFLFSEILRDYWLSGVRILFSFIHRF